MAVEPGKVRQFVAMCMGTGYSVEAQILGEETTGGLQFEITRIDEDLPLLKLCDRKQIFVKGLRGETSTLDVNFDYTVADIKYMITDKRGIPAALQRLIFGGRQLERKVQSESNSDNCINSV